jgi:hypothetical protein
MDDVRWSGAGRRGEAGSGAVRSESRACRKLPWTRLPIERREEGAQALAAAFVAEKERGIGVLKRWMHEARDFAPRVPRHL